MTAVLPDAERIVTAYLRSLPDITAITTAIGTRVPSNTDLPWVQVSLLNGAPAAGSKAMWFMAATLQVSCYAGNDQNGGQEQASLLARTVMAALGDIMASDHDDAIVTGVRIEQMARVPDPTLVPARERYIVTAVVNLHPDVS